MKNYYNEINVENKILNEFLAKKDFYYTEQEIKSKIYELESNLKLTLSKKELELYQNITREFISLEKLEMLRLIRFVLNDKI